MALLNMQAACAPEQTTASPADLQRFVSSLYNEGKPTSAVDELLAERRRVKLIAFGEMQT